MLVAATMLWVAYRMWRASRDWRYNAVLYAQFSRERGDARTETQRLAMGINLLWMGRGDAGELLARFLEWAVDDHIRHVAGDRIKGLLEGDPWFFFEQAAEAIEVGFAEEDELALEMLGRPIRDELNAIASECLIFGEWPFKYWLEHRPSGLEEINLERVRPVEEKEEAPAEPEPEPKPEPEAAAKVAEEPTDIVPVEKKAGDVVPVEEAPIEPLAKLPPDVK